MGKAGDEHMTTAEFLKELETEATARRAREARAAEKERQINDAFDSDWLELIEVLKGFDGKTLEGKSFTWLEVNSTLEFGRIGIQVIKSHLSISATMAPSSAEVFSRSVTRMFQDIAHFAIHLSKGNELLGDRVIYWKFESEETELEPIALAQRIVRHLVETSLSTKFA